MVTLFLGIEVLSIPLYVMAGSNKTDLRSSEAAIKYFLMGAFATGFLLLVQLSFMVAQELLTLQLLVHTVSKILKIQCLY